MQKQNLIPAKAPVQRLGKKAFAVENREWQGNPQLSIREVVPVLDEKDSTKVAGFAPVFKGLSLQGRPDDVKTFLEGVLAHASKLDSQ